jgi:hypothetical protein
MSSILIPYLGSRRHFKPRILPHLMRAVSDGVVVEYREPFVGGGVVGLAMMSRCPNIGFWLNDRDFTVSALWWSVRYRPNDLADRVRAFTPTVAAFLDWKNYLSGVVRLPETAEELVEAAFGRLVIQYTSGRAWGGGMRGGLAQAGQEGVASRWNIDGITRTCMNGSND